MPFSDDTKRQAFRRAGGACECTRTTHGHRGHCNAPLTSGNWHAHHRTAEDAGGDDSLGNCEALCIPCHRRTGTYGSGAR